MSDANIAEIGIGNGETMAGRVINQEIFKSPVIIRSDLTRFEQLIFNRLNAANGEIVSKDELMSALYPCYDPEEAKPSSNTIEVFVGRVRRKIGEKEITTVRGRGYKMRPQSQAEQTVEVAADPVTSAVA